MTDEDLCTALTSVAFTLRVTQRDDVPEELSFDQEEVRLGRTADNDVIIKDPASSRSHARVYEEGGRHFVEDLKSANGTTLNGRALKAPMQLRGGDRIAIGEVVVEFSVAAGPSSTLDGEEDEAPPPPKPSKPAARKLTEPGKAAIEVTAARGSPAVKRPSRVVPATPPPEENEAPAVPTAADRARERRELQRSSMGKLQLLWSDFPRPTRIAVVVVGGLLTLGLLGALVKAMLPKRVIKHAEPAVLVPNGDPLPDSFGVGPGVDFARPDMKSFTFSFPSPTTIVGVLHYQASDCGKDEVTIELNGTQIGTVPPDTVETEQRQLETVLGATQLKVNEANEVVFDNVSNPPATERWRIWNVWVEVIPVPQLSATEAAVRARDDFQRAARLFDLREVGAKNLFRAWKEYRDAWLMLEATPERPEELLQTARARMREIRPMLDKKCAALLVTYQKEMNQKQPDLGAARKVLQEIPSYFEKEHPCFGISRGLMANLEELSLSE